MKANNLFKWVCLLCLLNVAEIIRAQNITGKVVDEQQSPVAFANVVLLKTDSTFVEGTLSWEDGTFQLKERKGDCLLKVTSVGYQPQIIECDGRDVGTIILRGGIELDAITVTAQKKLVKNEVDRTTYDVQGDTDAKSSSVIEILRKVPFVTVDGQGNIKVNGSSNFKVYRNGRPSRNYTNNSKDVLSSIPADMVKNIEVITEPGAKYDGESADAILNIITNDKLSMDGVVGTAQGAYSASGQHYGNLFLTTQVRKFTLGGNYSVQRLSHDGTFHYGNKEYLYKPSGNVQLISDRGDNPGWLHNIELEASYEIDKRNLLSLSFGGYSYNVDINQTGTTSLLSGNNSVIYSYAEKLHDSNQQYFDFNGHIDYQHLTGRKGEALTFSYLLSTTNTRQQANRIYSEMENMPVGYSAFESRTKGNFAEHTFQFDWERPLSEHHQISVGTKYIFRDNSSLSKFDYNDGTESHSDFAHQTHIAAAYGEYRFVSDAWNARAGMRYEYSYIDAHYKDGSNPDFDKHLGDRIPSLGISYKINDRNTLKLNYLSRIYRPGIYYLNPAVEETPDEVSNGNPSLKSAHPHNISLSYMLTLPKLTANVSLSSTLNNTGIGEYNYLVDDVRHTTYENNLKLRGYALNTYLCWTISPTTSLMLNNSVQHRKLRSHQLGLENERWHWTFYAQAEQQLPRKIKLSLATGRNESTLDNLYNYSKPTYFYMLTLSRSFLKEERLSVRLMGYCSSGSFSKYEQYNTIVINGDYTGCSSWATHSRNLTLRVSYRFGSLKAHVKKTNKTIENEDLIGRK